MKAYSEVEVMVLREKYERSLTDLENNFYSLASQIVVGTSRCSGTLIENITLE